MKALDIFEELSVKDVRSNVGHWLYECKICKKQYHLPGKLLVKHFRQHNRKGERIMNEPKIETEEKIVPHGTIAVTEEEFNRIKELDFRGEKKMDIVKMSSRSYETVSHILRAKDFKEYKEKTQWYNAEARKEKKKNPLFTQYNRLQSIREQFDTALAEFIVTTAQNLNQVIWAENAVLRQTNEELKKQLSKREQEKTTDPFLDILNNRLTPVIDQLKPPVTKVLLPAYPDATNRLCYLREDLTEVMSVEKLNMFVEQMKNENKKKRYGVVVKINGKEAYPIRDILNLLYEQ